MLSCDSKQHISLQALHFNIMSCVYKCNLIASVSKIKSVTSVVRMHHITHNIMELLCTEMYIAGVCCCCCALSVLFIQHLRFFCTSEHKGRPNSMYTQIWNAYIDCLVIYTPPLCQYDYSKHTHSHTVLYTNTQQVYKCSIQFAQWEQPVNTHVCSSRTLQNTHAHRCTCTPQGSFLSVLLTLALTHALPRLPGYSHANVAC